jgi:DNA repair exonuclease SbcCD ATPase subunit
MPAIISINPTGCFSYGWHETVQLDDQGIIQLTGINHDRVTKTANASGKSSLLNAVCHVLFGEDPTGASDTEIVNAVWNKGCWAKVEFLDRNGTPYRAILARKWKGVYPDATTEKDPYDLHTQGGRLDGTDLYFDKFHDGMWRDSRRAKSAETRAAIIDVLGMSYIQFLTTSYLAQQSGSMLVTGKNKDRMKIITELTDMSVWDRAVLVARERLKERELGAVKANAELQGLLTSRARLAPILSEVDLASLHEQVAAAGQNIKDLESHIASTHSNINNQAAHIASLNAELERIRVEKNSYDMSLAIFKRDREATTASANNQIRMLRPDMSAVEEAKGILTGFRTQEVMLQNRLKNVKTGEGRCENCGSNVDEGHLEQHRAVIQAELDQIGNSISINTAVMHNFERRALTAMQDEQGRINQVCHEELIKIGNMEADIKLKLLNVEHALSAAVVTTQRVSVDMEALRTAVLHLTNARNQAILTKTAAENKITQNSVIVQQHVAIQFDIDATSDHISEIAIEIKRWNILIKGMGDKGIKAHKFGSIIATLNEIIAEYISVLTDSQVQVWFSPWREKTNAKTDDDIVAEVSIFVREGPKDEVELRLYSGAERQQVTIAIVCAFWRLATMQGGGTNILFLDEIFGMFDGPSAGKVINLLDKLRETHFGTIVVVTHSEQVKQLLPYDSLWTAVKQNHSTTLKMELAN